MAKAKKEKKRLVLLDAHAILHRAYHALPEFSSSKGEPTGALYGLIAMLLKIVNDLKPDYLVACYDLPEPTFRHEIYDEYKAGRKKTDEELIAQIIRSRDVFTAFDIPMYEKAGFEADDLLGTIVEQMKDNNEFEVVIASGDMDTLQLVKDAPRHGGASVQVYTLSKGITDTVMYDEGKVEERFGFGPKFLIDFKGLRGDPSDNIIGIVGIGEKSATKLVQTFGTIENMYAKLKKSKDIFEKEGIKPRIVNLLEEGEEEALFSKELATIRRDVPVQFSIPKEDWRETLDVQKILALFAELGFRTLGQRVTKMFGGEVETVPEEESKTLSERELKETAIALWILHSSTTNPQPDDMLAFTNTTTLSAAREAIFTALGKEKSLERIYKEIELPLIPVIEAMQRRGIKVDLSHPTATSARTFVREAC